MNKARRKDIDNILAKIEELKELSSDILMLLEEVKDAEQEAYDNMPESLQDTERGEHMQDAIESLEEAYSGLDDQFTDLIDEVTEKLETAKE